MITPPDQMFDPPHPNFFYPPAQPDNRWELLFIAFSAHNQPLTSDYCMDGFTGITSKGKRILSSYQGHFKWKKSLYSPLLK